MKGWEAPHRAASRPNSVSLTPLLGILILTASPGASAWGNGGISADQTVPDYGAHDWIAERAARLLPENESSYIFENRARFLYSTEIPDFILKDSRDHHVYFHPDGRVMEDNAAVKARDVFSLLVDALRNGDRPVAAEKAGILTHYVADLAVFGHVLSNKTVWGEEKHHADFEDDGDEALMTPESLAFEVDFDGSLAVVDAYDAAIRVARATTFGDGNTTARWLDDSYVKGLKNWPAAFRLRIEELVSIVVNEIGDVLHSAASAANYSAPLPRDPSTWPRLSEPQLLTLGIAIGIILAVSATIVLRNRRR